MFQFLRLSTKFLAVLRLSVNPIETLFIAGTYGEGAPPPPPRVPLDTFDTLSLAWLHSVAVHRRRSPKKTGGLNSPVRTLRRKTSYHFSDIML